MDGGIRRGADVLKALALGADAVLLGRPYAYGLAVGGAAGVEAVIRQLAAELDLTMALAGVRSVRDVDRSAGHLMRLLARIILVSATLATAALAAATGGSSSPSATVKVAFLQGEQVVTVTRNGSTLRQAIAALLAGPTAAEQRREIASAVPTGTPLRAVSVTGGVATVDLGEKFASGTNTASLSARGDAARAHRDLRQRGEVGPAARQGRHPAGALPRLRDVLGRSARSRSRSRRAAAGRARAGADHRPDRRRCALCSSGWPTSRSSRPKPSTERPASRRASR